MLKTLIHQIGEYRTASILTPVWTALEVSMDVFIPYVTASLIDKDINAGDMQQVYLYGTIMLGMAFLSLLFGILGGRCSAYAATGFAANLRKAMYRNIQRLAFSDIDKYATSGLITRMTTDEGGETVPAGVREVRRTEPERAGEHHGHPTGEGFRA